ncbi:MAG: bifunctional aspartate kinase/homoserine dehydrogenase I, partial [Treponema sp.]|nr:bifunctional aspartate kinase/homoserine dehydrogenase I [Treponema sp.]
MVTLKFGGTSMENARRMIGSADIIVGRAEKSRVSVIVSAVAGVSNMLEESIASCIAGEAPDKFISRLKCIHTDICQELETQVAGFSVCDAVGRIEPIFFEYEKLLAGCRAFGECPDTVQCRIMGIGEQLSAPIMELLLTAKQQRVVLLDSRRFIFTVGNQKEGDPDYVRTNDALRPFGDTENHDAARILLFPGFICSWIRGTGSSPIPGLLGRNGSDFSAAIIAAALSASRVEFWTDVDGIYTADPRVVKDAVLVNDMSYEEAIELAFFGSKVLHPKTLAPLQAKNIEAWSLNSHRPEAHGTRIGSRSDATSKKPGDICGISSLKNIALLSVSGSSMRGRKGTASRVFAAVSRASISVLLITQSSSEYTISFCIRASEANAARDALTAEFELEIYEGVIHPIEVHEDCAIVSIVGDNMIQKRGVAGRFFNALATQGVNITAIAQGSSERCISCVVAGAYSDTAVRAAHRFFFNTAQTIEVCVFGAGTIGGALLDQIYEQRQSLLAQNIDVRVVAIATVDGMMLAPDGIDVAAWRTGNCQLNQSADVDTVLDFVRTTRPLNPVFVDCTASYDLPNRYLDILRAGMSIVTPNKRANSMQLDFYHELRRTANAVHRRFLYETNVGAGLPIIDTLQNLFKSGDQLTGFTGIMSGSLSYIFGQLDDCVPFSQAVTAAQALHFTEPDPRDDLSGVDVARKALIIAREAGYAVELDDIEMRPVFREWFECTGCVESF